MKLEEIYTQYIRRCNVTLTEYSVKYYKNHLGKILSFLYDIDIVLSEDVTFDVLYRYVEFRRSNHIRNGTINKDIGALKQAFSYSEKFNPITNHIREFPYLKEEYQETKIIPKKYLKQIFDYVDALPNTPYAQRSRLAVYLLFDTGVRRNELVHLRLTNFNLVDNEIRLTVTKSNRNRTVYFSDKTKEVLMNYIKIASITDYLIIIIGTNRMMDPTNLFKFLLKMKDDLNFPKELSVSFHKFRHTYATTCLENGADLEFVRSTLGHASLIETQKYLHLTNDNKAKQHHDFGPLSNI